MSQAGKVLHLYVEVRSVPEEKGTSGGDHGTSQPMLQCPDVLPCSQRSSGHSSPSPNFSLPIPQAGVTNNSLPSKSSSRHSVTFQLHSPNAIGPPSIPQHRQQDLLYNDFGQLLQALSPRTTNSGHHSSLLHARSSDVELFTPTCTSSGRVTAPSTPTSTRKSYEIPELGGEEGKTSVVSYGYIEKSSIQNISTRPSSGCQNEQENLFSILDGSPLPVHLQKRLSDPMWYNSCRVPSSPDLSQSRSPCGSPYLQRATLDAVAREATYRALEEFGSPELRRRFAGNGSDGHSPTLPRPCRSWAGSPVLPRSSRTLPSKTQLLQLDRICHGLANGLPRSPVSDQLSTHAEFTCHPNSTLHHHGPPNSQHRMFTGDESPRLFSKFRSSLPAGRPTDIQHEIPTSRFQPRTGYQTYGGTQLSADCSYHANNSITSNDNSSLSVQNHSRSSPCSSRAGDVICRRSISPASSPEVAVELASEDTKQFTLLTERCTPSPAPSQGDSFRSESPKMGGSFLRQCHPYITFNGRRSHESQLLQTDSSPIPETRPGRISLLSAQKGFTSPASPALPARLHHTAAFHSTILDPKQQQSSSPSKDMSVLRRYQIPQYTGDRKPYGLDHVFYRPPRDIPEFSRLNSPFSCKNEEELPVSWASRHQDMEKLCGEKHTARVYGPSREEYHRKEEGDTGLKISIQDYHGTVMGVSKDEKEQVQDQSTAIGMSSHSSSGVTGSMADRIDSLSPETSSQSSQDMADSGSGMQVGWMRGWSRVQFMKLCLCL